MYKGNRTQIELANISYSLKQSLFDDDDIFDQLKKFVYVGSSFSEKLQDYVSRFNKDVNDQKSVYNYVKEKYKEKGIVFPKAVQNWLKKDKPPRTSLNNRTNMYDFCYALDMSLGDTEEFFQKAFLTVPYNLKDRRDAIYYYCIKYRKPYKTIIDLMSDTENHSANDPQHIQTSSINKHIDEISSVDELKEYILEHCYDFEVEANKSEVFKTAKKEIRSLLDQIDKEKSNRPHSDSNLFVRLYGVDVTANDSLKDNKDRIPEDIRSIYTDLFEKNTLKRINKDEFISYENIRRTLIILFFYVFLNATETEITVKKTREKDIMNFVQKWIPY